MAANLKTTEPLNALHDAYRAVHSSKPGDRSRQDRAYAVTLTQLENVIAYFKTWAIQNEMDVIMPNPPEKEK